MYKPSIRCAALLAALVLLLSACGQVARAKSLAERYADGELLYVDIGCPADFAITPENRLGLESAVKTRLGYPENLLFRYAEIGGELPADWAQNGPEVLLGVQPGEKALDLGDPAQLALAADRIAEELARALGIGAAKAAAPTAAETTTSGAAETQSPTEAPTQAPTSPPETSTVTRTTTTTKAPEAQNKNFSLTNAEVQKIIRDMENGDFGGRSFDLYGDPVPMIFDFNADGDPNTNGKMHIIREKFDGNKMVLHVSRSKGNSNDFEYLTTITQKVDNPFKGDPYNQLAAKIYILVGKEDSYGWQPCYEFKYIVSENQRFTFGSGSGPKSDFNKTNSRPDSTVIDLSSYFK